MVASLQGRFWTDADVVPANEKIVVDANETAVFRYQMVIVTSQLPVTWVFLEDQDSDAGPHELPSARCALRGEFSQDSSSFVEFPTSHSCSWVLVFQEDWRQQESAPLDWASTGNSTSAMYSILDRLEEFRDPSDGKFTFQLRWPLQWNGHGASRRENVWRQSSNPMMSEEPAVGYEPVLLAVSALGFGGLQRSASSKRSLLHGSTHFASFAEQCMAVEADPTVAVCNNDDQDALEAGPETDFYVVGSKQPWKGGTAAMSLHDSQQVTQLFAAACSGDSGLAPLPSAWGVRTRLHLRRLGLHTEEHQQYLVEVQHFPADFRLMNWLVHTLRIDGTGVPVRA